MTLIAFIAANWTENTKGSGVIRRIIINECVRVNGVVVTDTLLLLANGDIVTLDFAGEHCQWTV